MRHGSGGQRRTGGKDARRAASPAVRRCAIYTRKSSEEGLEQAFNSLDAQREACEAFILSQKGAGWAALPAMYDDGGLSGATLERPALQRVLADVAAGRVDTVVVYKVDRLTRSLSDFARIVDVFDAHGVAFVSVTQQFNTTSSMGRLTLNMLLSFAQFEREVTGERIRDKIALSKQKGMWMGGRPPLGYDVADRKLVINEAEADTVRHIYHRYVALRSVRDLGAALHREGIGSKRRVGQTTSSPLGRGALYHLLQNRLYCGKIAHKGQVYPGQHQAIVAPELWDQVQATLAENQVERHSRAGATGPSLLTGLVYDAGGERMSPTHANKKGTRYRYYVSRTLIRPQGQSDPAGPSAACRVPAADLEALVETALCDVLQDGLAVHDVARAAHPDDAAAREALLTAAADLARTLPDLASSEKRARLGLLISHVIVGNDAVEVQVSGAGLLSLANAPGDPIGTDRQDPISIDRSALTRIVPTRLARTGMQTRLLIEGRTEVSRDPDRSLVRLLARAHQFRQALMASDGGKTMRELADDAGVGASYFARVVRLAFLSPAITTAICQGRHPATLTANKLQHLQHLSNAWTDQLTAIASA